jgi:hypothetical protein
MLFGWASSYEDANVFAEENIQMLEGADMFSSCRIWGSHSGDYKELRLLRYKPV